MAWRRALLVLFGIGWWLWGLAWLSGSCVCSSAGDADAQADAESECFVGLWTVGWEVVVEEVCEYELRYGSMDGGQYLKACIDVSTCEKAAGCFYTQSCRS